MDMEPNRITRAKHAKKPGPEHDKTATAENTKGGNQRFVRRYQQTKM